MVKTAKHRREERSIHLLVSEEEQHVLTQSLQDEWRHLFDLVEKDPLCKSYRRQFAVVDALTERIGTL